MHPKISRRDFIRVAGLTALGATTPYLVFPRQATRAAWLDAFNPNLAPSDVFPLSVASGDPTPTGVILWTRIDPAQWLLDSRLVFEVALDADFNQVVVEGIAKGSAFGPDRDYTVKLDLDPHLSPNTAYFYRLIYRGAVSHVGRCRTLPAPNSDILSLKLALVNCQHYGQGYYAAYYHLAQEEDVDFVLHLGDYIYETDTQDSPYPDRQFTLPSGNPIVYTLEDYRFLYRTYHSDPYIQMAHERFTFINIWDDHETANDCYWDYDTDAAGIPDHPLAEASPDVRNQLKLAAMQAWSEYVPARPAVNRNATHPHDYLSIYRGFRFGYLVDLFMTDERTYRTPPPCGLAFIGQRYATRGCEAQTDPTKTMLGFDQRDWLVNGILDSNAVWKVWGNEVFLGFLKAKRPSDPLNKGLHYTLDGWSGYEYERAYIASTLKQANVKNLIVLTGDLHAYLAAYYKLDYTIDPFNTDPTNLAGVEFMTPSVSSSTWNDELEEIIGIRIPAAIVRRMNPHIRFFDGDRAGYTTVTFGLEDCIYDAYSVDRSQPDPMLAPKELIKRLRVPFNQVRIQNITP